jgi:hypothetical protein
MMSLDFAIDNQGLVKQQFYFEKNFSATNPSKWGTIVLSGKR